MEKEYVIWGIAKGKEDEEPLYTLAKTEDEARKVIKTLAEKYKCRKMRIQILDGTLPDFRKVF